MTAAPSALVKCWGLLAGLSGAAAVAVGAWASHGLARTVAAESLDRVMAQAQSATHQHLAHSLALLAVAVWSRLRPSPWLNLAGALFTTGITLFSFGIYVMYLWWPGVGGGLRVLVPVGGVSLILGWLALAMAALSDAPRRG